MAKTSPSFTAADLMAKLRAAVDEAADTARSLWGVLGILEDLVRYRTQLADALETLQDVDPSERDRVLREAQLAYVRHERDVTTHGRSGLVRGWTWFLVEAAQKVERDRNDAERFAKAAHSRSADDGAWEDAAGASAERWQNA